MSALHLEITTGGKAVVDMLNDLADSAENLAKRQDELTRAVLRHTNRADETTKAVQTQASTVRSAINPWERLTAAQKRHADAVKAGDSNAIKMAELQLARAEMVAKRADSTLARRANPAAFALQDMIMTSRIKLPGLGMMPLVGKAVAAGILPEDFISGLVSKVSGGGSVAAQAVASSSATTRPGGSLAGMAMARAAGGGGGGAAVAGASSMMMGVGIAAGAAAVALAAYTAVVIRAKNELYESAGARFASGSSSAFNNLAGIGQAFGMGPGQISEMARSIGKGLMDNPMAAAYAMQAGVNPLMGNRPGMSTDYAGAFVKLLADVTNSKKYGPQEALRRADALGMDPAMVGVMHSNPAARAMVLSNISQRSKADEEAATLAAIQYNIALGKSSDLLNRLGSIVLPAFNAALEKMLGVADKIIPKDIPNAPPTPSKLPYPFNTAADVVNLWNHSGATLPDFGAGKIWDSVFGGANGQADVTKENTEAVRDLNQTMKDGIYGAGAEAAARAVPAGTAVQGLERWAYGQRILMGGISL